MKLCFDSIEEVQAFVKQQLREMLSDPSPGISYAPSGPTVVMIVGVNGSGKTTTIRMLLAACKQREVDERIVLDDAAVIAIVDKLIKQDRKSVV